MDGEVVASDERLVPSRQTVLDFEASLRAFAEQNHSLVDPEELTTHWFATGIYCREMRIPAGTCLTGKIHRGAHLNIISAGSIAVLTEHGVRVIAAPCTLLSDAGIKRVGFALEDTVWTCIHANPDDCRDMQLLEARYIAPSFDELEGPTKPDQLGVIA